jgi:hypothetical protein
MHPRRELGVGIDLIWQYCESDIPGAGRVQSGNAR